jgi:uncharacterized protein YndB with AHSA1/START domain
MRRSFQVRVPPDVAFAFISDPGRAFETLPGYRVEWSGPIQPGATFIMVPPNPGDAAEGIVDEFEPPRHLSYRLWVRTHAERQGSVTMDFSPTADGTEVAAEINTQMGRLLELGAWALRPWLALQARRGTRVLVGILESEYRAAVRAR